MRYSISHPDGPVMSDNHRTAQGALRKARQLLRLACSLGVDVERDLTVSEFAGKHAKTGRPVMYISMAGERDASRAPLQFWSNGEPVI